VHAKSIPVQTSAEIATVLRRRSGYYLEIGHELSHNIDVVATSLSFCHCAQNLFFKIRWYICLLRRLIVIKQYTLCLKHHYWPQWSLGARRTALDSTDTLQKQTASVFFPAYW
jgi:hypothetical protein